MKLVMSKHPNADDTIYVLKSGTRVRIYAKNETLDKYLVVCVKDGKQFLERADNFKNPEKLPF